MGTALPLADDVLAAAQHGQWCPKMCTFACPVAAATGADEAVPWSFHREVADLGTGRQDASADVLARLALCNGCLACRDACTYDQNVPAQVVAARTALAAAGVVPDTARTFAARLANGLRSDGSAAPELPASDEGATTAFVVPQDATERSLASLRAVATRAGVAVRFVRGPGVGLARLAALGLEQEASEAGRRLVADLEGVTAAVVIDPELLGLVARRIEGVQVLDLASWALARLESGALSRSSAPALGRVTWHDPAPLARRASATTAPRQVLRLLGGVVVEPEGHGEHTVSAGPGLGMEVLAPDATAAVAARRAAQLAATGAPIVSTGPDVLALRAAGVEVAELAVLLASRTQGRSVPGSGTGGGTLPDAAASSSDEAATSEGSAPAGPADPGTPA